MRNYRGKIELQFFAFTYARITLRKVWTHLHTAIAWTVSALMKQHRRTEGFLDCQYPCRRISTSMTLPTTLWRSRALKLEDIGCGLTWREIMSIKARYELFNTSPSFNTGRWRELDKCIDVLYLYLYLLQHSPARLSRPRQINPLQTNLNESWPIVAEVVFIWSAIS